MTLEEELSVVAFRAGMHNLTIFFDKRDTPHLEMDMVAWASEDGVSEFHRF